MSSTPEHVTPAMAAPKRSGLLEILLVAASALGYSVLCYIAPVTPTRAFLNAYDILRIEDALGIDIELGLNRWLHSHGWIAQLSTSFYSISFFLVTFASLILMWRLHPERYRFARNGLFIMTIGAMITYWTYPLAPPRLLSNLGYVDAVATQSAIGSSYSQAAASLANPYGAMPSMHTGWALWAAIVLGAFVFKRGWQRLLLALHPLATIWIIIATANHYVLDAVAGVSYCLVGLALSSVLMSYLSVKSQPSTSGAPEEARLSDTLKV